jgi:hypothetical protein
MKIDFCPSWMRNEQSWMIFFHEQKMYIHYDMLLKLKIIKIMNERWVMLYSILKLDKGIEKYLN